MNTTSAAINAPSPAERQAAIQAAFHNAVALHGRGALAAAEAQYRRLLELGAQTPTVLTNYALLLRQTGRTDLGIAALRRALDIDPFFDGAYYSLGNAYGGMGDHDRAVAAFRRVAALVPDHVFAYNNIGNALRGRDKQTAALAAYERAIRSAPDQPDPRIQAGLTLQRLARPDEALARHQVAVTLDPAKVEGALNFGNVLLERGDAAAAARWFRRAARLRPDYADARGNLAAALRDLDQSETAMRHYRVALALNPIDANILNNLGNAFNYAGRSLQALSCYRRAIAAAPGNALARFDHGVTLLQLGRYREGWEEYEWRWGPPGGGDGPLRMRDFGRPLWRGEKLDGPLLIHAEQGMGDVLQFLRYLPMAAARTGGVALEIHAPLIPLVRDLPGVVAVTPRGGPLPAFDAHIPIMSLARVFGAELETLPTDPYLFADPGRAAEWADRLDAMAGDALRVGFVWAGSATFKGDALRSPRLNALAPLLDTPGVAFFSLQKGDGRRDLEGRVMPPSFHDLDPLIGDFADTAAAMVNLDVVVSSCTAPVHLAGALGVPIWIALPFAADWRWLERREDSPWYPSARLFRQSAPGRWDDVVARLAAALTERANASRPPTLYSRQRFTTANAPPPANAPTTVVRPAAKSDPA